MLTLHNSNLFIKRVKLHAKLKSGCILESSLPSDAVWKIRPLVFHTVLILLNLWLLWHSPLTGELLDHALKNETSEEGLSVKDFGNFVYKG